MKGGGKKEKKRRERRAEGAGQHPEGLYIIGRRTARWWRSAINPTRDTFSAF